MLICFRKRGHLAENWVGFAYLNENQAVFFFLSFKLAPFLTDSVHNLTRIL